MGLSGELWLSSLLPSGSPSCSPGFYVTFWQLSMYDIAPPSSKYDEEGARLRTLSRQEDAKYNAADRSADRAKRSSAAAHRNRRDRYTAFVNILAQEFKEQTVSRQFTIKRLAREKQHWFAHCKSAFLIALKKVSSLSSFQFIAAQ